MTRPFFYATTDTGNYMAHWRDSEGATRALCGIARTGMSQDLIPMPDCPTCRRERERRELDYSLGVGR